MLPQNRPYVRTLGPPLALALAVAALCAVLQALAGAEALRYERLLIGEGQPWRLLTGHFVHLGWRHWWLNTAGLVLVAALFADSLRPGRLAACLLFSALIAGAGLWALSPGVGWYVGLSGALHGLFITGLLSQWRDQPGLSWLILGVVTAKLVYEHVYGPLPGSEASAGGPVVVAAHSYGAIGGALFWAMVWGFRRIRGKEQGKR